MSFRMGQQPRGRKVYLHGRAVRKPKREPFTQPFERTIATSNRVAVVVAVNLATDPKSNAETNVGVISKVIIVRSERNRA